MVQMLLDKGTDVNAQGGEYGNALQAASSRGHDQVVQMLLRIIKQREMSMYFRKPSWRVDCSSPVRPSISN